MSSMYPICPRVSIVMPIRNEAKHIAFVLDGILAQKQVDGDLEVIVSDGMSDDGTHEILSQISKSNSRVRVIKNRGKIVSSGLNEAIRAAKGEFIVRMDAHTEYAEDYVLQCIMALEKSGADNVGGPARTKATGYIQRAIAAAYHTPCVVGGASFHKLDFDGWVDTVTYGCWPKSSFGKYGLFDEDLVRNQDDEHNLRITRSGGRIWQSSAIKSWYTPRASLRDLFWQYFQYGYWKVRVIEKHHIPASVRHLIPGIFVLSVAVFSLTALCYSACRLLLVLDLFTYAGFLLLASLLAAHKNGWRLLPVLPIVIACYQISYGIGFLHGLLDFYVMRHKGRFRKLTR